MADKAREAQVQLAEAVRLYTQQGVPIPFVLEGEGEEGRGGHALHSCWLFCRSDDVVMLLAMLLHCLPWCCAHTHTHTHNTHTHGGQGFIG